MIPIACVFEFKQLDSCTTIKMRKGQSIQTRKAEISEVILLEKGLEKITKCQI